MIKNKVSNILQILPENMLICVKDVWDNMERTEFIVKDSKEVNKFILKSTIVSLSIDYSENVCIMEIW